MKVFVASAWPYVQSVPHLGNLIGSILSADVFARYARLKYGKENVILVSGSDEHGTPIEVEAVKRGVNPKLLTDQAHEYDRKLFLDVWEASFDNYTRTESEVHKTFVREFMLKVSKYVKVEEEEIPYCERDKLFLPDRFVKGTCPYCGFEDARGDQCDRCGRLLTPSSLINPKCAICGSTPVMRKTKHWFFDLREFSEPLREWLTSSGDMPDNVKSTALGWINEGLKPRSLTRDNSWGIPAPFPGAEGKTIYVWFEALLGYLSATKEYFKLKGEEHKWREFWEEGRVKSFYFIGKDNIPFHAVILPAMLMASGENYALPTVIAATEYLLYEGQKFSKSRRIGIWIDEAPRIMDVEYWRFVLIRLRPEERDMNFLWREAIRIVNNELNDDIGNLVNRVVTMLNRYFQGVVPQYSDLREEDVRLLELAKTSAERMSQQFERGKLKAGSEEILNLAREANAYINLKAPWDRIKTDVKDVGNSLYTAANVVRTIAVLLYPIMPKHAQVIFSQLNLGNIDDERWDSAGEPKVKPGHKVGKPNPVFKKLPQDFEVKIEEIVSRVREEVEKDRPELLK
ncbi:MAG: methionine--tRNA ligase [Metallosphaera yellowstonensis]|uniref:Methionine--tRNA ligase n=1 Tax=Metallosphaera yellowstonensis MK1 TaxID=671065 RepID=H2C9G2_9CREN|nr:methionine--tRNA ligase [Metallosphaera yellowstonensis]EHP68788.1 methionyl-tRNA synthetase [Metallosphaera yellowstonensis MK1]